MSTIEAVGECYLAPSIKPPWSISKEGIDPFIRLSEAATFDEVGRIVLRVANCCGGGSFESGAALLESMMAEPCWILPGGLRVRESGDRNIPPSCCCGLETWREWFGVLTDRKSPWIGHDPSPWIEHLGDVIRVWSGSSLSNSSAGSEYCIIFHPEEFATQLQQVEHDLRRFLTLLKKWAIGIHPSCAEDFVARFDNLFEINKAGTRPFEV